MTASARRENFAKGGKGENVTSVTGERETVRGEEKQKGQKVNNGETNRNTEVLLKRDFFFFASLFFFVEIG